MTEIPSVWDRPACSLKSLVDGNTFPCVIKIAESFCSTLEELESGEILILHEIREQQFAVVAHPSRGELLIPLLFPFKVHLVPLDRLHEEYNTVEELFIAQPDYFRVLDAMPSVNIQPGTVMKLCARQNGVYHLECEAVGDAVCHEIVNLPLNQHGRFQPLRDAAEYLLEEAIASYPPPSDVGVRLINSSSTGSSMSIATGTHLPWDSGLRVLGVFHDETVIATTTVGAEPKEVLLLPKTLDVSVVPACESSVLCKQLTTAVRTPMLDQLVEQAMKFSSLRAYNWSCRTCKFSFEELMNHPARDSWQDIRDFQEPESARTAINPGKGAHDSRDATTTKGRPGQTPRSKAQPSEKRRGRVGLESLLKECSLEVPNDEDMSIFSHPVVNMMPSLSYRLIDPEEPARASLCKEHSRSETQSDLDISDASSDGASDHYDEVLSDSTISATPLPCRRNRKKHSLRRGAVRGHKYFTNASRNSSTTLPVMKSRSEDDLYRSTALGDHKRTSNTIPLPPRRHIAQPIPKQVVQPQMPDQVQEPLANLKPLSPRLPSQSPESLTNPEPLPPRMPNQRPEPLANPKPLPPRMPNQSRGPLANPKALPSRLHNQSPEPLANPEPLPPRMPNQRPEPLANPKPLPPRMPNQRPEPLANPKPLPPRMSNQSQRPLANPKAVPPRLPNQIPEPLANSKPLPPRMPIQSPANTKPLPSRMSNQSPEPLANPKPLPSRTSSQIPERLTHPKPPSSSMPDGRFHEAESRNRLQMHSSSSTSSFDAELSSTGKPSSDEDEDGYSTISDELIRAMSAVDEDGYSTVSQNSIPTDTSYNEDDGYTKIVGNESVGRLYSSDEEETGYSSIPVHENTKTENRDDGVFEQFVSAEPEEMNSLERNSSKTGQWNNSTGELTRRASYWYAYQHCSFRLRHLSGNSPQPYVNQRPLRPPHRRRQYSESTTKSIKKTIGVTCHERGMNTPNTEKSLLRKKSKSEGDVFQNTSFKMKAEDSQSDYYVELLPDSETHYLEPVDAFLERSKLQEDLSPLDSHQAPLRDDPEESILATSTCVDDQDVDIEASNLPCSSLCIGNQNLDDATPPSIPTFRSAKEHYSPLVSNVAPCSTPAGVASKGKGDEENTSGGTSPRQKSSQNHDDNRDYECHTPATEARKGNARWIRDGYNKDRENPISGVVCSFKAADSSQQLKEILGSRQTTAEVEIIDGQATRENINEKVANHSQASQPRLEDENVSPALKRDERPASYWYAYQHFDFSLAHQYNRRPHVHQRPLCPPRGRRQHSESTVTEEIKEAMEGKISNKIGKNTSKGYPPVPLAGTLPSSSTETSSTIGKRTDKGTQNGRRKAPIPIPRALAKSKTSATGRELGQSWVNSV